MERDREPGYWGDQWGEPPSDQRETMYRSRASSSLSRPARTTQPARTRNLQPDEQTLIVPSVSRALTRPAPPRRDVMRMPPSSGPSGSRWSRPLMFLGVILTIVTVLVVSTMQALHNGGGSPAAQTTPPPTGRGPWSSSAASVRVVPAPTLVPGASGASGSAITINALEPCHESTMFLPTITQWSVPPGCYGLVYQPNPANYVQRPGFGYCNWWVRVNHPNHPDITENISYPRGSKPAVGAAVFFYGNEQGATSAGHWAQVVAIDSDNYWVLISEMNFEWRGAGFGKIDYRYIHVSPGVQFIYIYN